MRVQSTICILLVLLAWAVFWPVFDCGFVNFDDPRFVLENPHVRAGFTLKGIHWAFAPGATENWHPLTWLSLMLDSAIYGDPAANPQRVARGFHATNLVLHTLSTLVLFAALARMTAALWKSAAVAALFAVHPLHVESVAWVAERKDVLSTLFVMAALWCYAAYAQSKSAHSPRTTRMWYTLALAAFACSLLSKQMYVTFPFLLLLLDYWPLRRWPERPVRWLVLEKAPFLLLAAVFCVIAYLAQSGGGTIVSYYSLPVRLGNAAVVYVLYLWKTVWPQGLAVFYPHPGDAISWTHVAAAGLFLAAVTAAAAAMSRKRPYLLVGWLWYLGSLVPVIGIVQIGMQRMADRYTYFPLVGVFLAAVWLIGESPPNRMARQAVAATLLALIAVFAVVARQQVAVWHDDFTLFGHAIAVTQNNSIAHNNLGIAFKKAGRRAEAFRHFQAAVALMPNSPEAHNNLGIELFAAGQPYAALEHFETAARLRPSLAAAWRNLARTHEALGNLDAARQYYLECLRLNPNDAVARAALERLNPPQP